MAGAVSGDGVAGELTPEGHVLPVRVYHEDTDFTGVVYHGSFVRFFERGRSDFLRLAGVSMTALDRDGLHFVVAEMALKFRRAAVFDDLLKIVTTPAELTAARAVLRQTARRGAETLVSAEVTVALVGSGGRPARFPSSVSALLRPFVTAG